MLKTDCITNKIAAIMIYQLIKAKKYDCIGQIVTLRTSQGFKSAIQIMLHLMRKYRIQSYLYDSVKSGIQSAIEQNYDWYDSYDCRCHLYEMMAILSQYMPDGYCIDNEDDILAFGEME